MVMIFLAMQKTKVYTQAWWSRVFFIKHTLTPYINIVKSDSDFVMWFKINKSLFKTSEDILFGVVYISPPESRFHNVDEIELFEVEIIRSCIHNDYVLLMGVFNARTHVQSDILEADDFIVDHFNFDTIFPIFSISYLYLHSPI